MFCPECGTKNPDDGNFCENCGAKLEHPQTPASEVAQETRKPKKPRKPRKPMPLAAKIMIPLIAVLIAAGIGGFFILKSITNPKNIVTDYAKAYVSHDAKALFNSLNFNESSFLTPEKFEKVLQNDTSMHFEDATDYSIKENSSSSDDNSSLRYTVTFRDSSNAFEYSTDITLNKLSTKSYLLFDNWKIKTDSFLAKDCAIRVPSGAAVTVDDVKLGDSEKTETEEEGYDTYQIKYMFTGKHDVAVSLENFEDCKDSFNTTPMDYEGNILYTLNSSDLTLSHDISDTLIDKSKELLQTLYSSALEKKEFDSILSPEDTEGDCCSTIQKDYDSFVENHIKDDTHLKSLDFTSIEGRAGITSNFDDNCTALSVSLETKYTAKSVVENFWTDKKENKSYDGSSVYTFTYHYKNGKWLLTNADALGQLYYTRY